MTFATQCTDRRIIASLMAEAIGTFYFLIVIAMTANSPLAPLAIGVSLGIMIFTTGHVSGGHLNPAVTLGAVISGKLAPELLPFYWASQLAGGFAGAGFARIWLDEIAYPAVQTTDFKAIVCEMVFTFYLVFTVLNTACANSNGPNSFFGISIGFTVFCGATAIGGISGGAMNPAVGTCLPAVAGKFKDIYIYWIGPLLGGSLAAMIFRYTNPDTFPPETVHPRSNSKNSLHIEIEHQIAE